MSDIRTHANINRELCGTPVTITDGQAVVTMIARDAMSVDAYGLVHGGFIFGLADHAAMLAVNHPNVVLAQAEVRFLAPVRPGDELVAEAQVTESNGKKRTVSVTVSRNGEAIFSGIFHCAVLERHVLEQ
jgi:uncharacterized protein (TIGR00369 family)